MNPTTHPTAPPPASTETQPPPLLPPQPPLQPHRPSTFCDRHPEENFTGFCPSCLCERLAVLDPNSSAAAAASSSRKPPTSSTAAAALKSIFKPSSGAGRSNRPPTSSSSSSSFFPELRRTKSFSASKNEGFSGVFEPQRKSCDVRVRSNLSNLFNHGKEAPRVGGISGGVGAGEVEVDKKNPESSSGVQGLVIEFKEEAVDENQNRPEIVEEDEEDEIRVLEEPNLGNVIEDKIQEIVQEEETEEELKTMKDHIDLDSQAKKTSGIAGSFFSAASVFSKKLQKWRQKQKMKKHRNADGSATLPVEKPIGKQFRETQSEIADYGFGRRSCDIDPRFSLDAGRISFEDPRYSFDEPRASWDGYLIGKTFPRMPLPTMLSVVEDDAPVHVLRTDAQIPVEEPMNSVNEDDAVPGGSVQTREYYSDSSSRRRKSLDRSNSTRKAAAAIVAEMDELKLASIGNANANANANAKVTPATVDYRDLRDSNLNSLRDDCSETFEMGFRDTASVIGNGDKKGSSKKSRRWSKAWNIWGLIHRRGGNKDEDEERYSNTRGANGVERSFSQSWQELRGDHCNGDGRGAFNPKMLRSNSSVSWRNAQSIGGESFGTMKKNGKNGRDGFVLERNKSARYSSSNNIDNGYLGLYMTRMSASRRNGSWKSINIEGP